MQRDSDRQGDEDAWRAIVENYGDRIELDDEDGSAAPPAAQAPSSPSPVWSGDVRRIERDEDRDEPDDPDDRFVPPVPPPLPAVPPDRLFAWMGLFGAPAVLLLCLVVGFSLPAVIAYLLVAAFIGGFVYLVVTMPRGPADPFDDGARL